jgi:hypothetical protein
MDIGKRGVLKHKNSRQNIFTTEKKMGDEA